MLHITPFHLAISEKLGWGDMFATIAVPAIEQMINNYAFVTSDMYGMSLADLLDEDGELHESFTKDVLKMPADNLFSWLILDSIEACYYLDAIQDFVNLRGEIEAEMRKGKTHNDAIVEWYK